MKYILGAILLVMFHIFLLSKLQFTAWPEMLSYPYLLDNGFNLYKDIALPYQPLLPIILNIVYKTFGYSLSSLLIFTWIIILINDVLIFYISLKLIGKKLLTLIPLATYILLQTFTEGNMLWFDLATIPFILLAILSLLIFKNYKIFFWFGLFLSFAFFIKQQTGIIYIFLLIYLILGKKFREVFYLLLGSLILTTFVLLYIQVNGIFRDWIFWTIEVPLLWYPKFPSYSNLPSIKEMLIVTLLVAPGIISTFFIKRDYRLNVILLSFLGAFISALPRFEYFRFQPALALYIVLISLIIPKIKKKYIVLMSYSIILSIVLLLKDNLHFINLQPRFYSERELKLSKDIIAITNKEDKIFILNENSGLYVLSNRLPPKPWVDNYVWYMEIEGMQEKVLTGFKNNPPKIIFRRRTLLGNWFDLGTYEPKKIVEYIEQNYKIIGTIDSIDIWTKN